MSSHAFCLDFSKSAGPSLTDLSILGKRKHVYLLHTLGVFQHTGGSANETGAGVAAATGSGAEGTGSSVVGTGSGVVDTCSGVGLPLETRVLARKTRVQEEVSAQV